MPDPLERLRRPAHPVQPRRDFADDLRDRLRSWIEEATTPGEVIRLIPVLYLHDAKAAIRFYADAFGAVERSLPALLPDERVHHAELRIGLMEFVVADEFPELGLLGPRSRGGPTGALILHVPDLDLAWARATSAGATVLRPVARRYGLRAGWLLDPFGHRWAVAGRP